MTRAFSYLVGALAIAVFPLLTDNAFHLHVAQTIALTTVAAVGLNLLLGLSGQMSLGQAGFYAVGAYGSAILAATYGWPLWLSMPAGVVVAGLAGLLVGVVALRTRGLYLAMATLAFGFIVEILAQRWVDLTGGTMGLFGVPQLNFGDFGRGPTYFFWVAGACLIAVQILSDYLHRSSWGRDLRALKESESFARTIGLNVPVWRTAVFALSAGLAGLAGVLFAHQNGFVGSDAFTLHLSLALLIATVIGGLGRSYGPTVGTVIIVAIGELIAPLHDYASMIYGAILLVVLLLFPEGAIGLVGRFRGERGGKVASSAGGRRAQEHGEAVERVRPGPLLVEPAAGCPALELRTIMKRYSGVVAVDGVSLAVRPGTVHAVIGPNGAGKSTLINVVAGLYQPDGGAILLNGVDVTGLPAHRRARLGLGRTFQNLQLVNELTVLENVMLGARKRREPLWRDFGCWLAGARHEGALRGHALEILRMLRIDHLAGLHPADLSYGHRKLCELARSVAQSPRLMLLDEPVAGLNEQEALEIAEVIAGLKATGTTILLVEHNIEFVMRLSDVITVLDYGQKIAEGPPEAIRRDAKVIEAYLGKEAA